MLGITDLDPSMDNNPYSNIDPIWTYGVHQLGHDDGPNQRPHPTLPAAGGRRARDGRLWCSDGRSSGLRRARATTEDSRGRPSIWAGDGGTAGGFWMRKYTPLKASDDEDEPGARTEGRASRGPPAIR